MASTTKLDKSSDESGDKSGDKVIRVNLKHGGTFTGIVHRDIPFGCRGERPCTFDIDGKRAKEINWYGIPGVVVNGGRVECAWDAVSVIASLLSEECPPLPTGELPPLPGRDRYNELEMATRLRPYQKDAALFLAQRAYCWNSLPMRCLSGDTLIRVNRSGGVRTFSLAHLVHMLNGGEQTNGKRTWAWDLSIPSTVASFDEQLNKFTRSRITASFFTGQKEVFRLRTETGKEIKASADHEFFTGDGWKRLRDLSVRDAILTWVRPEKEPRSRKKFSYLTVTGLSHHPFAKVRDFRHTYESRTGKPTRVSIYTHAVCLKHRLVAEASLNNLSYEKFFALVKAGEVFGLVFLDPSVFHVHHKNHDIKDNRPENLEIVTPSEHATQHNLDGHSLFVKPNPKYDAIQLIETVGLEDTFDLVMEEPHRNYVANEIVVHNCGKTLASLAATTLVDAQKVLVIPPAFVTREWSSQIARYVNEEAVTLTGRACREIRIFCKYCIGKGYVRDSSGQFTIKCDACKPRRGPPRGETILAIQNLQPVYPSSAVPLAGDFDVLYSSWPASSYSCSVHPLVIDSKPGPCPACYDDMIESIDNARFIIVNPELLMSHPDSDARGRRFFRKDLPGWAGILSKFSFDIAVLDECHESIRGFELGNKEKISVARRERVKEVVQHIPRIWGVTGTPMFGYTRDYWSQLDIMSKGLWSAPWCEGLPFSFGKSYCAANKDNPYGGYNWDGRGPRAETELEPRLALLKFSRPRSVILPFMPRKTREVITLDVADAIAQPIKLTKKEQTNKSSKDSALSRMMARAGDVKRPIVIQHVLAETHEGNKVIVFARLRTSVEKFYAAVEKTSGSREHSRRATQTNLKIWSCHGDTSIAARLKMAETFQAHDGAGIFIASIDAFQKGVSLASRIDEHPTSSVHFLEFHASPMAMLQAEDRPYEPGSKGLSVFYYIARGTIDDRIERLLIPKVEAADAIEHDEEAASMGVALKPNAGPVDIDDIIEQLCGHIPDEIESDDEE